MNDPTPIVKRLYRLQIFFTAAFLIVLGALFYWSSVRGEQLAEREDNPRLVEEALRVNRGRILDREGLELASSVKDENGRFQRRYPYPAIGPAVGYYNFRHGTSGAEAAYDDHLRGEPVSANPEWEQLLLNEPRQGLDIRLSLDADMQIAAAELLDGRDGALLILDLESGDILVMVTNPGFDPNNLEANFAALSEDPEGPLLNRALQGAYQPGRVLMPMLLASALDQNIINLDDTVPNGDLPLPLNGKTLTCLDIDEAAGEIDTWSEILQHRCPYPLLILADRMGETALRRFYTRFAFNMQPAVLENEAETIDIPVEETALAAIGQDALTLTPLQVARAWGAILNEGALPAPRVVTEIQTPAGEWEAVTEAAGADAATSALAARTIRAQLGATDEILYAVPVLAGPSGGSNSWVLGAVTTAAGAQRVFVLVLEADADWQGAAELGREILQVMKN